ncbi:MAG: hypothetical protein ACYS8L_10725 [Planctomycetota bacterium]|jgi:hypothetical protein
MSAEPPAEGKRTYGAFGWQGVNLTLPSSWELAFTQGNFRSGYVRLADERSVRLEVRWEAGPGELSVHRTVDRYISKLSKRARKEGAELAVQRDLKLASPTDKETECYRWVARRQGLAMLSRCAVCRRVVHLQLLADPQEPLKGTARTVFSSLRDHSDDDWLLWRFLDVEFRSPVGLPLARPGLQSGCIRMGFARRLTRLEFVKVSLAEVLLARSGLADWFGQFYGKSLKRRSYGHRKSRVKGHPALDVQGRVWLLVNPMGLFGRRRIVRAACWHCEPTNRLFVCCFDGPKREAEWFPQALAGFRCCEGP